jgi:hypothetical protein
MVSGSEWNPSGLGGPMPSFCEHANEPSGWTKTAISWLLVRLLPSQGVGLGIAARLQALRHSCCGHGQLDIKRLINTSSVSPSLFNLSVCQRALRPRNLTLVPSSLADLPITQSSLHFCAVFLTLREENKYRPAWLTYSFNMKDIPGNATFTPYNLHVKLNFLGYTRDITINSTGSYDLSIFCG